MTIVTASEQTVIVGGGLAAVRTAQALRDGKYPGRISVFSEELYHPYDRPPLSKNYLLGKSKGEDICLLPAEQCEKLALELVLNSRAISLDRANQIVHFAGGGTVRYDRLVVATGARPVRPALFEGYENIHFLRSMNDADGIRQALKPEARIAIVGGGFIGLEVASIAHALGCKVIVLEAAPAPLVRAIGVELGQRIQHWHERKGIAFRCGSAVESVVGDARLSELVQGSGERIAVDAAIVGVGQRPNVDWLLDSGLEVQQGLVCDSLGRTLDPKIYAVGDVAWRRIDGKIHPTLHWTATGDQASQVAQLICGISAPEPIVDDHYFWSDQHGMRLQFVGRVSEQPRIVFAVGAAGEDKFVALCCEGDEVTAVLSLGNPRDFLRFGMPLRRGERVAVPTEFA